MLDFVREHARGLVYSVLVHLVIVAGLVLSVARFTQPAAAPMRVVPVVQSSVVDMSEINRQVKEQERAAEQERIRKAADEQARQVALKKKQEQDARQAKLKAEAEKKKQADILLKRKADEKAAREKAETDKQRLAEKKRKEEEARKTKLEAERKAEEARKAKLEADRKAEELRKKKEAEARQRAEAEGLLRQQLAEEEARMAAERSGLLAQYIGLISQKIERNWIRPASARPGLECVVQVTQIPGGQVVSVQVVRCNGDDTVVRSVEAAVYQASPLPDPPDPSLFERKLQLVFKPTD
jgi:colicin import membrane protein